MIIMSIIYFISSAINESYNSNQSKVILNNPCPPCKQYGRPQMCSNRAQLLIIIKSHGLSTRRCPMPVSSTSSVRRHLAQFLKRHPAPLDDVVSPFPVRSSPLVCALHS